MPLPLLRPADPPEIPVPGPLTALADRSGWSDALGDRLAALFAATRHAGRRDSRLGVIRPGGGMLDRAARDRLEAALALVWQDALVERSADGSWCLKTPGHRAGRGMARGSREVPGCRRRDHVDRPRPGSSSKVRCGETQAPVRRPQLCSNISHLHRLPLEHYGAPAFWRSSMPCAICPRGIDPMFS